MMTPERVQLEMVQTEVGEFIADQQRDNEDLPDFDPEAVKQEHVEEINKIIGASAESYVPQAIFEVLADDDLFPEDLEDKWIRWFEEKHA